MPISDSKSNSQGFVLSGWRFLAALVTAFIAVIPSRAAPLQTANVAATAIWVIHFDWAGLRPTMLGKYLSDELANPEFHEQITSFESSFHIDTQKQVSGITVYSLGKHPDQGIMLVYGDFDPVETSFLTRHLHEYKSTTHGKHLIHSWTVPAKDGKKENSKRTFAAFHSRHLIVFGGQLRIIETALDVADRRVPGISKNKLFSQVGSGTGARLIEAAIKPADLDSSDSGLGGFRSVKLIRLRIAESDSQINAILNFDDEDEANATRIATLARGLLSISSLGGSMSSLAKIAEAISVKRDGTGVTASLMMPAKDFVSVLKTSSKKKDGSDPQK